MLIYLALFMNMALASVQDWPEEAKDYLNKIPGQELQLDFVVSRAIAESDALRLHQMEYLAAEAQYLSALSVEDFKINASLFYTDNRNEPLVPEFMANSTKSWEAKLGFEQFFASGTSIAGDISHSTQEMGFASFPERSFKESRLSLSLDQSLLKDFAGASYRNQRKASKKESQAREFSALHQMESSVFQVIQLFYQAWYKQEHLKNLKQSLSRRRQLNRIFQRQRRKGLVDSSDALQVESMVLTNEVDLTNTKQDLQSMWEDMVTQLKLPLSFLEVPAEEVPIVLDRPEAKAVRLCKTYEYKDIQKNSSQLLQAQNLIEAAQAKYEGLKPQVRPDLKFQAQFVANGIDENTGETWEEVAGIEYPSLNLGLALKFPLQNRQAKANLLIAKIELERAQTNKRLAESDMKVQWRNLCSNLNKQITNREHYKKMSRTNKERVRLNKRKFRLGRIRAFEWSQTEDDEALSFLQLQQSEIQVRLLAWEVQKLTGHLNKKLKEFVKVDHE